MSETRTPEARTLVLRSPADLARLEQPRRGLRALRVELPDLSEHERQRLQLQLARDYFACGCGAGRAALIGGLFAFALALALPPELARTSPIMFWTACAGLLIGTVALSQQLAVLSARRRLRATLRALRQWYATAVPTDAPQGARLLVGQL
jgi:hypothetical protein